MSLSVYCSWIKKIILKTEWALSQRDIFANKIDPGYKRDSGEWRVESQKPMRPKAKWAIDSDRGHEGERNNCFSEIQLVGSKYLDKTT